MPEPGPRTAGEEMTWKFVSPEDKRAGLPYPLCKCVCAHTHTHTYTFASQWPPQSVPYSDFSCLGDLLGEHTLRRWDFASDGRSRGGGRGHYKSISNNHSPPLEERQGERTTERLSCLTKMHHRGGKLGSHRGKLSQATSERRQPWRRLERSNNQ